MFKRCAIILCLLFLYRASFSQFVDNFLDTNFTTNPTWMGDTLDYEVNESLLLHLNASSEANISYLVTPSLAINNAVWEFFVQMDFNPSSNNFAKVYLVADQENLEGPLNGYFIKIGNTSDEISLYRQDGLVETEIIDGFDDRVNTNPVNTSIRVTRDDQGNWQVFSDTLGGTEYVLEGTIFDNNYVSSSFFGVLSNYTSSRSTLFFYDNFNVTGQGFIDNIAPQLDSLVVIDSVNLMLYFSEPLDLITAQDISNYVVDGNIGNPNFANRDLNDFSLIRLNFSNSFTNGQNYSLTIVNVEDTARNRTDSILVPFSYLVVSEPNFGEIVINEIFADPSPSEGLPTEDYIELFNNTNKVFDLTNCWVSDLVSSDKINDGFIFPEEYVIVCNNNFKDQFLPFGKVVTVNNFPSLNNAGDKITLYDIDSNVIYTVHYSAAWYQDDDKEDGGWSLEIIDPNNLCGEINNWRASVNEIGGTPGIINSINATNVDIISPKLLKIDIVSDSLLKVYFDEPIDTSNVTINNFSLSNEISISKIDVIDSEQIFIVLANKLLFKIKYELLVQDIFDCAGNAIEQNVLTFALPEEAFANDIVINEILFNPFAGGVDFLEIYNNSDKIIDMKNWTVANLENGAISNNQLIADQTKLLFPSEFALLTKNVQNIQDEYFNSDPYTFIEMVSFPAFNNDEGDAYLIANTGVVIDSLHYEESTHFSLLNDVKGVSLERIDYNRPTNDVTNWHSASEDIGYATPGIENSQYQKTIDATKNIKISPKTFSPNNDGIDDVVNISYSFNEPGYVGSIVIYDTEGRLIRKLVQNKLLGNKGTFSWDGINQENGKANVGIYVIYFEAFNINGKTINFKEIAVLASQLK